jgi:tetratricopeptide (TPR) repeat protein
MKFRDVPALAIGALALTALAAPSHAAVSVLGTGLGQSCYEAAEFGGDPRDGVTTCTTALDDTALTISDRAATFVNRGILRARSDDANGALDDYDRGISLDANLAEAYVDRGATMISLKRYDQAVSDLNRGISMNAKRPHIAYYDRAIANEALGNIRAAYEDYKQAVQLQPDFTLATEQLARFKVVRKSNTE